MRSRLVREANLFWTSLIGEVRRGRLAEQDAESSFPSEGLPAGQTASPCDVAKTSETLDRFALESSALTRAHRTTIGRIADCLLALAGGSRPIRTVNMARGS